MHPTHLRCFQLCAALLVLLAPLSSHANDGGLTMGGTPRLLDGHPTVKMESERIIMTVGETEVQTDCHFVFRNEGPTCRVRMGFPDKGEGEGDPDEAEIAPGPPRGTYRNFRSWVNGRPVQTSVIRARRSLFYHTKLVTFPAHSVTQIRDAYTQYVGGQIIANGVMHQVSYILQSGASWHGPIGRSEIVVTFRRPKMATPLVPARMSQAQIDSREKEQNAAWTTKGRVYYKGPCAPTVQGKTLHFVRTNWHPTRNDDIRLYFDRTNAK